MGIFRSNDDDDRNTYDDEFELDDEQDEVIERFSRPTRRSYDPNKAAKTAEAKRRNQSRASRQPGQDTYARSTGSNQQSYAPPASAQTPLGNAGTQQAEPSAFYKVEPNQTHRRVEELYIASLTQTNDAMSVADLVKERKYALIIDMNTLKNQENKADYASVINFIDGVCYVTDSELKEIIDGCGIYLIYHRDVVLNEGLDSYYQSSGYKF